MQAGDNTPYQFTPKTLDDFHPDTLYAEFPAFQHLKQLRKELENNSTFAAAAKKLEQWLGINPSARPNTAPESNPPTTSFDSQHDGLLDSILDNSEAAPATDSDASTSAWLRQLIDDAVAPYTLPAKDSRKEDYIDLLDRSISDLMRSLLHQPQFKSLENHWRGLDFILRRSTSEAGLNIYIWDVTKEELLADLAQQADATQSDFFQRINQQFAASNEQLSAIVSTYEYSANKQDALMLGILAKLCTTLDCPLIANANASLAHCESFFLSDDFKDWTVPWDKAFAETWQAIRNMPESHYIALTAPGFLIRYPYSSSHYRIESFKFDELPPAISRNHLPWAPGAFAVAAVLATAYNQSGWQFQLGDFTDISGLPIALFEHNGQKEMIPTGECFLSETMFNQLCDAGLTPITGLKNSDTLKIGPIIGLHERSPLLGPWIYN